MGSLYSVVFMTYPIIIMFCVEKFIRSKDLVDKIFYAMIVSLTVNISIVTALKYVQSIIESQ